MNKAMTVKFQCPADKFTTEILFRRPPVVGAEIVQFQCSACKSHLLARVKRGKDFHEKANVNVQVKIVRPSAELIAMLKQEQEVRCSDE